MSNTIHTRLKKEFRLPPWIAEGLEKYYVLHWQGSHILHLMDANDNNIPHQDVLYIPVFLEQIVLGHKQYQCSFRKMPEYPYGYVLIKELKGKSKGKH